MKLTQTKIETAMNDKAAPAIDHGHASNALQIAANVAMFDPLCSRSILRLDYNPY